MAYFAAAYVRVVATMNHKLEWHIVAWCVGGFVHLSQIFLKAKAFHYAA